MAKWEKGVFFFPLHFRPFLFPLAPFRRDPFPVTYPPLCEQLFNVSAKQESESTNKWLAKLVVACSFFLGISSDTQAEAEYLSDKIVGLRIFSDDAGKFAFSVQDVQGEILVVSQFTLYGDIRKGRRPSFTEAAGIDIALPLYEYFVECVKRHQVPVATGQFQATMAVQLVNDGPVTLIDRKYERGNE